MHDMNEQMMHALMHWKQFNFTKLSTIEQKPKILKVSSPRNFNWSQITKLIKLMHVKHVYNI